MAIHVTDSSARSSCRFCWVWAPGSWYDLLRAVRLRHPPTDGAAGPALLSGRRSGGLSVRPAAVGWPAPGVHPAGGLGGGVLFFSLLSRPLRPVWDFWMDRVDGIVPISESTGTVLRLQFVKNLHFRQKPSFIFSGNTLQYILKEYGSPFAKEGCPMESPSNPQKRKNQVICWSMW